ncbi:CPBP family intramembrane metalloprotease [Pseudoduganella sp. FT25W]|uniref:CPBP family intramembrane metalloprotease n=1 Tax=Duganella alba TaxID=2666081 RepID=A0A6L5QEF0_9BURK|nr:type II CAAX endopeptidase family protein [Duganella alba]MRX07918.1 CPBP family intramembrane metalloprotease [Duganella alba]MRX15521.1 CPBP family intramembrane metalloprotease [Duganella alba]
MTALRTIWLMTRMRLTRQRNMLFNNLFRFNKKKPRDTSGGKRSSLWVLTLAMVAVMSFSFVVMSHNVVLNMQCQLDQASKCLYVDKQGEHHSRLHIADDELASAPFAPALMRGLGMEVTILLLVAVLLPLGNKELAQPDWDLEWLVTMPVSRATLLWGRVLERSASNIAGWFALLPAYGVIAWYSGYAWSTIPIALLAAAMLLPLAAMLHTLADTGLRMWLPAAQLRNLQAVTGLLNLPLIYFVMALGMPQANGFAMNWARAFPSWAGWLPPGLVLQAIQAQDIGQLASSVALLLAEVAAVMWAGMALLRHQLRHGVVNSGARESVRRVAPAGVAQPRWLDALLSPLKRRELRLLSRDRNFLFQTLLLPVIIVGSQVVFNGKLDSMAELGDHHLVAASIAFGIGVYVLMLSAFQTLNNEGQVLWLLYTLPRSIESMLKEKAQLWGTLALVYPAIVIGMSAWYTASFEWEQLVLVLTVFAGIPIYSMIAVSLGVFACDPLAVEARARVRPTYVYLYMLLASFYTWSIYSNVWSQKLVVMVLVGSMALALWQKARDALPYLLDPAAAPPPRVSTADGLIAATAFFILQGVILLIIGESDLKAMTIAFSIAGLTIYMLMRYVYWRSKTAGVPAILRGIDIQLSLRSAAIAAAVACAAGLGYLATLQHTALWDEMLKSAPASVMTGSRTWILALAVVAAPLCEEFIFRGLIYGGLRRSMKAPQAMVMSAAVFAVVHPPLSMLPVFMLGLCTAWTYERSKTLLAPMLVHATYNAAILSSQFWQG